MTPGGAMRKICLRAAVTPKGCLDTRKMSPLSYYYVPPKILYT